MTQFIELKNITKQFSLNGPKILDQLNLNINKGSITFILGLSGTGKSVTLKHINGLLKPDSGEVLIENKDINKISKNELFLIRKRMGYVFQHAALFDSMTVYENLSFALKEMGIQDPNQIEERVTSLLKEVGIYGGFKRYPNELSGGQKKRVGLARSLLLEPEIVLYDEPTTGLDPIMADVIDNLILKFGKIKNRTSVIISHDIKACFKIADQVALIHKGKLEFYGKIDEVQQSESKLLQALIKGDSMHHEQWLS